MGIAFAALIFHFEIPNMQRASPLKLATVAVVAGMVIATACSENGSLPTGPSSLKAPGKIAADISPTSTVFDFSAMAGTPDREIGASYTFTLPVAGSIVASMEQTRPAPGVVQLYAKGTAEAFGDEEKGLGFCFQPAGLGDECTNLGENEIGDRDGAGHFPSMLLDFRGLAAGTSISNVIVSSVQGLEAYQISSSTDGVNFTPFASGVGTDAQPVITIPVNSSTIKYLRFEVGSGGNGNNYLVMAATVSTPAPPEETPCPGGSFTFTYDATGLHIKYDQFPAPNDNSYGTNAVGWGTHGHKFTDLVGSDHAGIQIRDAQGVVRLSFNVDYLTAMSGAPSGYASLGVTGGDGKMLVGTADGISATTSLARNLNGANIPGLFVGGVQQFGSVNVLINSPPTDPAHTTYNISDPTLAGWDFHDTYYVDISIAKLNGMGFDPTTWHVEPNLDQLHNSPPKACPTGPGSVSATKYEVKDKQVKVTVTNTGTAAVFLESLTQNWPAANGNLVQIKLDGDVEYNVSTSGGSISLTTAQLPADPNKRKIDHNSSDVYTLIFANNADTNLANYSGTVTFSGTTLTILPH